MRRGADGTVIHWQVCYTPNPWARPLHPVLRPLFARDFRKAARQLGEMLDREA